MYLDYARTVLAADERFDEKQRERIAQRIVKWAEEQRIKDLGKFHDELATWIDYQPYRERFFIELDRPIDEDTKVGELIEDPRASTPPEILVAGSEKTITANELQSFISEEHPELADAVSIILSSKPNARYRENDLDPIQMEHRLRAVAARTNGKKLLIPDKQVVRVGFENGNLQIAYRRGYSDKRIQKAIEMRLDGYRTEDIAEAIHAHQSTVNKWLRECGIRRTYYVVPDEIYLDVMRRILDFVGTEYKNGSRVSVSDITKQFGATGINLAKHLALTGKLRLFRTNNNMTGIVPYYGYLYPRNEWKENDLTEITVVYNYIHSFYNTTGLGPTYHDLKRNLGMDTVEDAVERLRSSYLLNIQHFNKDGKIYQRFVPRFP